MYSHSQRETSRPNYREIQEPNLLLCQKQVYSRSLISQSPFFLAENTANFLVFDDHLPLPSYSVQQNSYACTYLYEAVDT